MIYTFIAERCSDLPVSACCRVMKVSTLGYYQRLRDPVTDAELAEAHRADVVFNIGKMSRHSYGMPRIRSEFRLGRHEGISRTTIAPLMGICGAVGIHYRRRGGCTRPGDGDISDDLVNRAFDPARPNRLWCMDITEHPTGEGKVYLAVVLDAFSRRVIGWSIADHTRAELVADALQMPPGADDPPRVRPSPTPIMAVKVTVRYNGQLHHIGVGRAHTGTRTDTSPSTSPGATTAPADHRADRPNNDNTNPDRRFGLSAMS
jgi:hypothetical protein